MYFSSKFLSSFCLSEVSIASSNTYVLVICVSVGVWLLTRNRILDASKHVDVALHVRRRLNWVLHYTEHIPVEH